MGLRASSKSEVSRSHCVYLASTSKQLTLSKRLFAVMASLHALILVERLRFPLAMVLKLD